MKLSQNETTSNLLVMPLAFTWLIAMVIVATGNSSMLSIDFMKGMLVCYSGYLITLMCLVRK